MNQQGRELSKARDFQREDAETQRVKYIWDCSEFCVFPLCPQIPTLVRPANTEFRWTRQKSGNWIYTENFTLSRNTQFNNALPTSNPLSQIESCNVSSYKSASKMILALKLWILFAVLLIGSIFIAVIGFANS